MLAIEAVGDHGAQGDASSPCGQDQLQGELRLGAKRRMLFAACPAGRGRLGPHVSRVRDPFIGPQAGHRHDAIRRLAEGAQILRY